MKKLFNQLLRTDLPHYGAAAKRAQELVRLSHAADGLCTESAEFKDALKKHIYYGKELDVVNLKEEIGDIVWYLALACDFLGVELEECAQLIVNKLKVRYPEKFTEEDALNRDLETEKQELSK